MDANEWNKHLAWAERLCSRREYCVQEIRMKFKAKGLDGPQIEELIVTLQERNFVDEQRYVHAFVHDKSQLQGWGAEKIRYALRARQIPEAMIREALAGIDPQAQKEKLRRLLETKRRSIKAASEDEVRAKLIRFGLARGFAFKDVIDGVRQIFVQF